MSHKPAVRAEVLALAPRIRSDDAVHHITSEAAAPRLEGVGEKLRRAERQIAMNCSAVTFPPVAFST